MDRVEPDLQTGSVEAAWQPAVLRSVGITRVVNVTAEHPPPPGHRDGTLVVPTSDQCSARLLESFDQTTRLIGAGAAVGASTLVHCQQGISRSAAVVLAYLMTCHHWRLSEAWDLLRSGRPQVEPHPGFLSQLRAHERRLFGDVTSLSKLTFLDAQRVDPSTDDRDPTIPLQAMGGRWARAADAAAGCGIDACVAHLRLSSVEALLAALPVAAGELWQAYGAQRPADGRCRDSFAQVRRGLAGLSHPPLAAIDDSLRHMAHGEAWQQMLMDMPLAAGFLAELRPTLGSSRQAGQR